MLNSRTGVGALLFFLLTTAALADGAGTGQPGAWAERVQILYREESRSVVRTKVRVWDPYPAKNLDFVWEPDKGQPGGGVGPDGLVSGKGKLVWRVKGSASYDPRTIFSVYAGEMRDGRPEGKGRLEIRSGEVLEGTWKAGLLEGNGIRIDADGNRYEGSFVGGRPHGAGRLLLRNGEIYAGPFVDGMRHGKGRVTLAGGTSYESTWERDREVGGLPDRLADAGVGGLLRAQSGGGQAGKVEISTVIDQRMTQQSDMQYQHLVRDEDVAIYPVDEEMNNAWNGTGLITTSDYIFNSIDWEDTPAFVEVDLATTDGSRVKLDKLELQVSASDAYRKPMLSLGNHLGCVGFRPSFTVYNHGWGGVKNASVSLRFVGEGGEGEGTRTFTRPIADFDSGIDVMIKDVIAEAGVDTNKLETQRFSCPSMDRLNVCRSQVFNAVGFGEMADYVWGEDKLFTTAVGTFDYDWNDDYGNTFQASESFQVDIALATIELPKELAECGDGFGGSPEALRYQDVKLRIGERDYVVDMPLRGNKSVREYTARLKMWAEMTSFHQFQTVARFADGSERRSKPVSFFYFRPRPSAYQSNVELPVCYLDPTGGGC
jgi:hypothetical protein